MTEKTNIGIHPDYLGWEELKERLSNTNMVYYNGHVGIYAPWQWVDENG